MTILGIELDSINQVACLPEDKLLTLRELIHSWMPRCWCRKQELESLIDHLHHAANVVWPRRAFPHRFIELLCCFHNKGHPVRINQEFCLDLQLWQQFLTSWHGVGFCLYPGMSAATDLEFTSEAAGAIGFGVYSRGQWFYGAWPTVQARQSIAYQELFPVVIAAYLWGSLWARKHVLFRPDNEVVVAILTTRTLRVLALMHLLRDLLLSVAHWVLLLLLLMLLELRTKLLMLSLVSVGRSSGSWPRRLIHPLVQFLDSCSTA